MGSPFLHPRYKDITPYTPGEQPTDREYVKLNANETSVPPAPGVQAALGNGLASGLGRYADPYCMPLRQAIAKRFGVDANQVFVGNGSDEVLGFILLAFLGDGASLCFPDITYGFYRDYCSTFGASYHEIPLREDFSLDVEAFARADSHVLIANPNAPTGMRAGVDDIARICTGNPNRLVIVDEAYVDYGSKSCACLLPEHSNLIVVQTMSKSRNLAGAHIGYALADSSIIDDLRDIKFSFNPFNVSSPTMAIGIAALEDEDYFQSCIEAIVTQRLRTTRALESRGFIVLPSHANFVFACHPRLDGETWNSELRSRGVLCRHYQTPRIKRWLRITIGTEQEMDAFLAATDDVIASLP